MYTASIKVRFYETDMMEVAHHTNHLRWFELARVEFFRNLGISLWDMMNENIVFPIMEVSCSYHSAARFDDVILVNTSLVKMSRAQMVFKYQMIRESDGMLVATGKTKNAFANKLTGKITRLEDKFFIPLSSALEEES